MQTIKNIIFDFGGVIYDIDHLKVIEKFNELGIADFAQMYSKAVQNQLFERLETGHLSDHDFINEVKNYVKEGISNQQIIDAWNAILVGFTQERLNLLEQIKGNYNLFLLSNSTNIHYQLYSKQFSELTAYEAFEDLFQKAYFSFNMGLRKPNVAAYQYVLDHSGLIGSESLFVDDSEQNIAPARQAGMKAYHLKEGEEIMDLFENNLLK